MVKIVDGPYVLSRKELHAALRAAWWNGHEESRYSPNLAGQAEKDCREIIDYLTEVEHESD